MGKIIKRCKGNRGWLMIAEIIAIVDAIINLIITPFGYRIYFQERYLTWFCQRKREVNKEG